MAPPGPPNPGGAQGPTYHAVRPVSRSFGPRCAAGAAPGPGPPVEVPAPCPSGPAPEGEGPTTPALTIGPETTKVPRARVAPPRGWHRGGASEMHDHPTQTQGTDPRSDRRVLIAADPNGTPTEYQKDPYPYRPSGARTCTAAQSPRALRPPRVNPPGLCGTNRPGRSRGLIGGWPSGACGPAAARDGDSGGPPSRAGGLRAIASATGTTTATSGPRTVRGRRTGSTTPKLELNPEPTSQQPHVARGARPIQASAGSARPPSTI